MQDTPAALVRLLGRINTIGYNSVAYCSLNLSVIRELLKILVPIELDSPRVGPREQSLKRLPR